MLGDDDEDRASLALVCHSLTQKLRLPDDAQCVLQDIWEDFVSATQETSMCEAFLRWLAPEDIADSVMDAIGSPHLAYAVRS